MTPGIPQARPDSLQLAKPADLGRQSGGKTKRRQRGVGVVSPTTGTAAGWLPIHSLSSLGLGAVSLPSCMTNDLPNVSQPKKLWVLAFKGVGHKTSDEKRGKGSNSLKI